LANLAEIPHQKPVSTVSQDENFYPFFIQKYISLLYDVFNWVTPGQSTTNCVQLFGIFIMMQRSCFKQLIVS